MRVTFTADAKIDLREISDYIAKDNPHAALAVSRELRRNANAIGDNLLAHPLLPRFEAQGVRRRVAGSYLIPFHIVQSRVVILRILHGARDYDRLLRQRHP